MTNFRTHASNPYLYCEFFEDLLSRVSEATRGIAAAPRAPRRSPISPLHKDSTSAAPLPPVRSLTPGAPPPLAVPVIREGRLEGHGRRGEGSDVGS